MDVEQGAPVPSVPRFFLDRNLGSVIVPGGLRDAGWDVVTMDEAYGPEASQDVADIDWIRDATARGECLLTKDVRIARNPVEAQIVYMCEARVFTVTDARISAPEALGWMLRNQATIFRWATLTPAPFVLGIYQSRSRRLTLRYP